MRQRHITSHDIDCLDFEQSFSYIYEAAFMLLIDFVQQDGGKT